MAVSTRRTNRSNPPDPPEESIRVVNNESKAWVFYIFGASFRRVIANGVDDLMFHQDDVQFILLGKDKSKTNKPYVTGIVEFTVPKSHTQVGDMFSLSHRRIFVGAKWRPVKNFRYLASYIKRNENVTRGKSMVISRARETFQEPNPVPVPQTIFLRVKRVYFDESLPEPTTRSKIKAFVHNGLTKLANFFTD